MFVGSDARGAPELQKKQSTSHVKLQRVEEKLKLREVHTKLKDL